MSGMELISVKMLGEYQHRSDVVIIDLRSEKEYRRGHLSGAINIPYEDWRVLYELPLEKDIILYCERGSASLSVGKEMAKHGYCIKSISGGARACRESGIMY